VCTLIYMRVTNLHRKEEATQMENNSSAVDTEVWKHRANSIMQHCENVNF
jgi:hypothetical protein